MAQQPSSGGASSEQAPQQSLSLWDSTSIIIGIIVGSAIYRIPPDVAKSAGGWAVAWLQGSSAAGSDGDSMAAASAAAILGVWMVGGLVALVGAMCYAELATAFPHAGGTYVYLSNAFGRTVGFAFAWSEFWIVRPGNIGIVAFVLAQYALELLPEGLRGVGGMSMWVAAGSILVLALLNACGIEAGKQTQNILTSIKVAGLCAIIVAALVATPASGAAALPSAAEASLSLALINIMFAYGGWADISFVAAEVRRPERNLFRALALGTAAVTAIYVVINAAFLYCLGVGGVARSPAVAAEALGRAVGSGGARAISVLVVISCLGAINGMLFTGARVFYALGAHHDAFRWLGSWNARRGVPLRSLALQTLLTIGLVVGFGWHPASFERLVVFTAPFYWGFIGLVGIALVVLRLSRGTAGATYRVPFFPLPPLVFAATSAAMVYAALDYAYHNLSREAWWAGGVTAAGLVAGAIDWWRRRAR